MEAKLAEEIKIKVGDKEIVITEETLNILREYARTQMTLEELAEKLGLESWEEAYEFVKKIPAWLLWTPPTLLKIRKRLKH
ncbi:MAG: hypothetical protein DRN04_17210 [Thermoprotei archaeon]|nr:MAG: hypothetical protein DRN04_17210 [Thermoprotei archaeon]